MNKSLLEIYALSVCFVSVACLSIFSGILLYSLVELVLPFDSDAALNYYPVPIQHQQGFALSEARSGQMFAKSMTNKGVTIDMLSPEQQQALQQRREKQQKQIAQHQQTRHQSNNIKSTIRSLIVVFIASIVFYLHWTIAKKARNTPV
jgi:hypothetical protein